MSGKEVCKCMWCITETIFVIYSKFIDILFVNRVLDFVECSFHSVFFASGLTNLFFFIDFLLFINKIEMKTSSSFEKEIIANISWKVLINIAYKIENPNISMIN